jgi:hypothetical protein
MASAPFVPTPPLIVGTFDGIVNTITEERLKPTELAAAVNVDIDDAGQLHRRRGQLRLHTGNHHSAITIANRSLVVRDGVLCLVNADYSVDPLVFVGPERVCYTNVSNTIYFSNDRVSGKIVDGVLKPWGEQLDRWVSPVIRPTETLGAVSGKLLGATPRCTEMESYKGRIYMAHEDVLWYTELFLYDLVDKNRGYIQFEDPITMIMSVSDGFYVGTEQQLIFMEGAAMPGLKMQIQRSTPVIRGSCVRVPYAKVLPQARQTTIPDGEGPVFMTSEGVCVGTESGNVFNLTQTKFVFPVADTAATLFREDRGLNSYVAATNTGGTPGANARIGDYVDADIVRAADRGKIRVPNVPNSAVQEYLGMSEQLFVSVTHANGVPVSEGYGFVDYSDLDAPFALPLPQGVNTQVTRNLAPIPSNSMLKSVFFGHAFWDGTKFTPRALDDVVAFSVYMQITPQRLGGVLTFTLMAGGLAIETYTYPLTGNIGVPQPIRADFRVAVRSRFLASGGIVMLNPSVPCVLTEFSPEVYPESAV